MAAVARIAISRRKTAEALVMHVYLDGWYHRRSPGRGTTACGIEYNEQFAPVRPEQLAHPLSRGCGCFTPFELAQADAKAAAEQP
jgi:hypothetical protein